MAYRIKGYRAPANPERAAAMRDLRRSSAAQPHEDKRTKRARSRSAALSRAVREEN